MQARTDKENKEVVVKMQERLTIKDELEYQYHIRMRYYKELLQEIEKLKNRQLYLIEQYKKNVYMIDKEIEKIQRRRKNENKNK